MKKSSLIFLLALMETTCAPPYIKRVLVEIPRPTTLHLENYKEIRIAEFFVKDNPTGLALNQEISGYFKDAWEKKLHKNVIVSGAAPVKAESLKDAAVWKQAVGDAADAVIMAGQASFVRESRKTLKEQRPGWNEGYFAARNILDERLTFTFDLSVVMVRGGTGEILFQKDFKETRTYANNKQMNEIALYELLQSAKQKLFRAILGEERLQERYLISK